MNAIELFAGAGGLGMGLTLAGFKADAVVEWDKWACDTIRQNKERGFPLVMNWPLVEADVREWINDYSPSRPGSVDLVAGGPPCQPFSMGGKHRAHQDARDMFPVTVEVIRRLQPRAFIVENVKGLTRSSFHNYYQYILLQLEHPEVVRKGDESWIGHYQRLQQLKSSGRERIRSGLTYNVLPKLLNAANYGIPQRRERVFIVGFRSDLKIEWDFPRETHALHALLHDQWVSGKYWERHAVANRNRPTMPDSFAPIVERIRGLNLPSMNEPWRTVRDALVDLPDPERLPETTSAHNHKFQPGAKPYPGHTGSSLDLPAKTLKAGDHGVPGGENMLVKADGTVRYFSIRESARLQTFPDGYVFHGSWTEAMRQLGNAVPVALAHIVAASVAASLADASLRRIVKNMSGLPFEQS
jgi:DNA (cytosine-5)-methyltransferase 1